MEQAWPLHTDMGTDISGYQWMRVRVCVCVKLQQSHVANMGTGRASPADWLKLCQDKMWRMHGQLRR